MPRTRIGNIHLYYELTGSGAPLVFLSGLGMSTPDWEDQVSYFSKKYAVLTFDPRGHGKSDKPRSPYSIPILAADAAELIRSLSLSPAHIVGLSMGGMTAFQLAAATPELIRSMVIVNSGPNFFTATKARKIELAGRELIIRVLGMRMMSELLSRALFPRPDQYALRSRIARSWGENDRRAYLATLRGFKGWSVVPHLHEMKCPTLVISADEDYTPVAYKEWYVASMPNAKLVVIPDSRHATPLDQPERFNRVLDEFLRQNPLKTKLSG